MLTIENLARFQFAMTTIFHFFFVPLSVGMVLMTAIMETIYVKTGDEKWKKRTKFFGSIMLLSFAVGVVTGIIQEFQFGIFHKEHLAFSSSGTPRKRQLWDRLFCIMECLRSPHRRSTGGGAFSCACNQHSKSGRNVHPQIGKIIPVAEESAKYM